MSDQILGCTKMNDDTIVIQYDIAYAIEHGAAKNQFCVTVSAGEMTNSSDELEAVSLANVKAKAIKDAWIADMPEYTTEAKAAVVGEVTL